MYVNPGYTTTTQTYVPAQRRGVFGGIFRGRNRQVYGTAPYGTTYSTVPYGTTYGTTPGYYTYGAVPRGY